ncbi:thioredoxin-like protein [Mariannaea sp. PMI_226]|nr:thioredoxin-like protein [Mariannaea sp. PMI_226]
MPSHRRVRLFILAAAATFVFVYFYSGFETHHDIMVPDTQGFFEKTKNAMDNQPPPPGKPVIDAQTGQKAGNIPVDKDGDGDVDKDDRDSSAKMQERLKVAEQQAKDKANKKGGMPPDTPRDVVGVGSSADGQDKDKVTEKDKSGSSKKGSSKSVDEMSKEDILAEAEIKSILKKAPMIIFSKSYCPFSKRAKGILLEKYTIIPEPYVVELDKHPLTTYMQDQLERMTGRRTVPNIIIKGESIGGADDIVALDNDDKLVSEIIRLGGGSLDISERFVSGQ